MNSISKIIIGILAGGLIIFLLLWQISGCNYRKTIAGKDLRIANCEHAPIMHDTVVHYDTVIINRVKVLKEYHTDTIIQGKHLIMVNTYNDTLRTNDFDLVYEAKTIGLLKEIDFPWYRLHTKEIFTTKTVDTCFQKKPAYFPKNHLGIDFDLSGNNIKQMPNIDAVLFWSVRDKWKLNVGGEYNAYHSELYAKIGIGIYFR